jgi:hypothetical protein
MARKFVFVGEGSFGHWETIEKKKDLIKFMAALNEKGTII